MSSDQNEQEGLRLLSIDGGGIRGLSSLIILKYIMHQLMIKKKLLNMPLPCEYFSMMAGTGTGGLIVLMLGRLRMSVDEAIKMYSRFSKEVFSQPKWSTGEGRFSATRLERAIKEIIQTKLGDENAMMKDDKLNDCRVFVCTRNILNMNAGVPVLLRTYTSPEEPGVNCMIWEAARATSAVPMFFKSMKIGSQVYIDGGMGINNPTQWLLQEAMKIFPNGHVSCIISIGAGKGETIAVSQSSFIQRNIIPTNVIKALEGMASDCEEKHQQIMHLFTNSHNVYFRFNVEQGMQTVLLSDWEKLANVEAHTTSYLADEEVKRNLSQAVDALHMGANVIPTSQLFGFISFRSSSTFHPKRLPPKPLLLIGRDHEKQELVKSVLNQEPCIIHGTGGIGKTNLALAVLHDDAVKQKFKAHRYFLNCETSITVQAFHVALADVLGVVQEQNNMDLREHILDRVSHIIHIQGNMALCIDNFETIWDAPSSRMEVESTLSELIQQNNLSVILTMRGTTLPLPGVKWSNATASSLPPLSPGDAFAVFQQLSHCSKNDEYARNLMTAAGGVPLVLTLLGSLANGKEETTKEVWDRWQKSGTLIATRSDGTKNHLMDLNTSITLSLESPRLKNTPYACLALAILSLHPGGLGKSSEILSNLSQAIFPEDPDLLIDSLQMLVQTSLANIDEERQFRLLNPISHFASKRLDTFLPHESAIRLIRFYIQFIWNHNVYNPSNHDIVRPVLGNVEYILLHALSQSMLAINENLVQAVCSHSEWMTYIGGPSDYALLQVLQKVSLSDQDKAECYFQLGEVYRHLHDLDRAEISLLRAAELHQQAQSIFNEGKDWLRLGELYMQLNQLDKAEESLFQAVKLHQHAMDVVGEGSDRTRLGELYMQLNQLDKAEESLLQAVELHHQTKAVMSEGTDRMRLGQLYIQLNQLAKAEELLLQAVKLHQQAKDVRGEGSDRLILGRLYMKLNQLDKAEEFLLQAVKLHQQAKDVKDEGLDKFDLGRLYMHQNRLDEAEPFFHQAAELYHLSKDAELEAEAREQVDKVCGLKKSGHK